ncbi:hypothetical protein ES708_30222 [subsurface metagenome]
MAKLRGPLLSFAAIGRLGKNLVIRRHGKDYIAETHPHPRDARSPAQLSWRNMYQKAAALWHTLSSDEKMDWERLATPNHMTGYAYFMSQTLKPNPGIYLPLQGGSMQGAIAMNFNRITTLPPPGQAQDPARLADLQSHADLTKGVHALKGELGFSVYQTSNQSIPDNANTIIEWHAKEWDVGEYFDLANNRYIPQIPGKYAITTAVQLTGISDGASIVLLITKNGGTYKHLTRLIPGGAGFFLASGSCNVFLNGSTDYIQALLWHNDLDARDTQGTSSRTWFQGFLIAQT